MIGMFLDRFPARLGIVVAAALLLDGSIEAGNGAEPHVLWYDQPATTWTEALPIGNGRLGAMICGVSKHEQISP